MAFSLNTSVQEAAANFASTMLASLNAAAAEIAGVDVMWFRAVPDKKSQDVLFQNYTLWGVEDCPLTIKCIYTESNYDEAGMVYGIFGTEYITPFYIEMSINTWKDVTDDDGTIPQQGDIVFIPNSRKLLQVKSMVPIKQMGAQLTGYKVSLEEYKPTRSRIVGENLRTSIEESTTNLDKAFGSDIEKEIQNIVDDAQTSMFSSTSKDTRKKLTATYTGASATKEVNSIVKADLTVDGHVFARSYYDLSSSKAAIVKYLTKDFCEKDEHRCLSFWYKINEPDKNQTIKNLKDLKFTFNSRNSYIDVSLGSKFDVGDEVQVERGDIFVIGTITKKDRIEILPSDARRLNAISSEWYSLPGFVARNVNTNNILRSSGKIPIDIYIKNNTFIEIDINESKFYVPIENIQYDEWNAYVINIGNKISVDAYTSNDHLVHESLNFTENKKWNGIDVDDFSVWSSDACITNIRLYDIENTDIDRQIKDILSYNTLSASNAIINDSADVYLNKSYTGKQR